MEEKKDEHSFVLRINEELWNRFIVKLPESISINEKIVSLIRDWVLNYEYVLRKEDVHDDSKK